IIRTLLVLSSNWRTMINLVDGSCSSRRLRNRVFENAKLRGQRLGTRVRFGHKRLRRLSREATLGGIFLSFFEIGLTGFGGGLAVIAQIRALAVYKRRWFTDHEFAEAFALAQR